MVTAWVAATRVITLLAMRSSLSRFPGKAKNKLTVERPCRGAVALAGGHAVSVVRDTSSTASVRQFAHRLAGDTVIVFFLPATDILPSGKTSGAQTGLVESVVGSLPRAEEWSRFGRQDRSVPSFLVLLICAL